MKMSGADFSAFLTSKDPAFWPEGLYIEEELLRVNGVEAEMAFNYSDTDVIEILGGSLAWDDVQKDRESPPGSLVALARRWLKAQTTKRVVIMVSNDRLGDLKEAMKPLGAKMLG